MCTTSFLFERVTNEKKKKDSRTFVIKSQTHFKMELKKNACCILISMWMHQTCAIQQNTSFMSIAEIHSELDMYVHNDDDNEKKKNS